MDPSKLPRLCAACHESHGASRSPMLPASQRAVCLSCHGFETDRDAAVQRGLLGVDARPPLLGAILEKPTVHPISDEAFSRRDPGAVTCTSCHSPHRGSPVAPEIPPVEPRRSPRDPRRFEYELCQECHGNRGAMTESVLDLSRLFAPSSRSSHPVQSPAAERSPSVIEAWAGREVACSDCHGNDDPAGSAGPHGSGVRFLLGSRYTTVDGSEEQLGTYALCYRCHDRERVLDASTFPAHRLHVVEQRASCATCHSAHGAVENRALIRFGEGTEAGGVAPSVSAGRLAFESDSPGSGACYLTCHGSDHGPFAYGTLAALRAVRSTILRLPSGLTKPQGVKGAPGAERPTPVPRREETKPPPRR